MSKLSRIHRGPRHGEETRMHARRTAALIMGAALVLVAACGDDDDSGGASSATTAAGGAAATTTAAGGAATTTAGSGGGGGECVVGVSWNNYQEERWAKWDEPALKEAIEAGGGSYVSNDAKSSAETQASNVENLISQGANVLIVLAQDGTAIKPSVASATSNGIPVIAYDRLIEDPAVLYATFDNVEVGRMQAREIFAKVPKGNYVIIKGNAADANADFLRGGFEEIIGEAVKAGDIKIVGETYTDNWDAALPRPRWSSSSRRATTTSKPCSRRTTRWPVASSPHSRPRASPDRSRSPVRTATRPPSTASPSGPRRSASGRTPASSARRPVRLPWRSAPTPTSSPSPGPSSSRRRKATTSPRSCSKPQPITTENLDVVLDAGWIDKATLCQGVPAGSVPACA